MMKKTISFIVLFCLAITAKAHTVWLETNTSGKLNKQHEVKIFFGELESPTFSEKWFSDIRDIDVKVTYPSGKVESLQKTKRESHYVAFFTPTEKGTYTVSVAHLVKDVFREMKITYQSVAFVNVNSKEKKELQFGNLPVQLSAENTDFKVGQKNKIKILKEGNVAEKERVNISYENGWGQSFRSNNKGEISFTLPWKGKYIVEYSYSKKETGTHNGADYKSDYQTITYVIYAK
ncbi:DUF4198 domain-containing protein [Capnocytophaga canis]|uniref:DUF4198 domain-containing protein n=2 Tax=Capnocytophaga canis TaxID=1848903 RepID=UPI00370D7F7D